MAQDNVFFSKDYIEHLRSVHFTLIGVSIILGFLAFSPAPSQYEEAKAQLVGIQRLDRAEVGNIVNHEYQEALRSWNHSDSVTLLATDATLMSVPDLNRSFNISFKPLTQGFARPIPDILGFDPSEPPDEPMDPHSFRSLIEFRKFWDSLYAHSSLALPRSSPTMVFTEPLPHTEIRVFEDPAKVKQSSAVFSKGQPTDVTLEFELAPCDPAVKKAVAERSHVGCRYMYLGLWSQRGLFFAIPVEEQGAILQVESQRPFLEQNKTWVGGKFVSSFALLNELSTNIQDLPLESLRRVLETEETRKGDSFEVVGIKFPSETTKWAGFVVLCGIQLYLGLLFREQPVSLEKDSPGNEIAWIGIYTSAVARVLVFVTLVPLPTLAFAAMAFGKLSPHTNIWRLFGLSCSAVAVLTLSVLTWTGLRTFRSKVRTRPA